jgi:hypothetical protein
MSPARPVATAADAPILSQRTLNRAVLARQLLLERADLSLPEALEQMGGVQNQYAPNAYIRLWSCLTRFGRADLTAALERQEVIQATLMRQTIHTVSTADYWPLAIAVRRLRRNWFARVQASAIGDTDMDAVAEAVRSELANGPRPLREIADRLGARGFPAKSAGWVGEWIDLVRVPPSGTWERRRADLYGLAEQWVGPPPAVTEEAAIEHLLRRYLGAFGPASADDAALWAGLPPSVVKAAVERLELRRFRDESGQPLIDLPGAWLPDPDTPAPVRFLPTWDATLLVHARRTGIMPEPYRPIIFSSKNPPSSPTFLVDGRVAGTWRHVDGRIETTPFEPLPRRVARELADEAERLAAFHAG